MSRTAPWIALAAVCAVLGGVAGLAAAHRWTVRAAPEMTPPAVKTAAPTGLRGRVTDREEHPLEGVLVRVEPVPAFKGLADTRSAVDMKADAAGDFAFRDLPEGDWRLRCSWDGAEGIVVATVRVPGIDRVDVHFSEGWILAGTITDADTGDPITHATVKVYDEGLVATAATNTAGRFTARTHRPAAQLPYVVVERGGERWRPLRVPDEFVASADGGPRDAALAVRQGAMLTGTVTGLDGPVAGARVTAWVEEPFAAASLVERHATTGPDGRYGFDDMPEGDAYVVVDFVGLQEPDAPLRVPSWCGSDTIEVEVPETGTVIHDVTMERLVPIDVEGRVVDADGRGVDGAEVGSGFRVNRVKARTGPDGRFLLAGVTGSSVSAERGRFVGVAGFDRPETGGRVDGVTVTLENERTWHVHGRVTNADGAPVANARVVAIADEPGFPEGGVPTIDAVETVTAADGTYDLQLPDPLREFAIRVAAHGYAAAFAGTVPTEHGFRDTLGAEVDVVVDPGITLAGRIVRSDTREPVAGAYVAVTDPAADRYRSVSESPLGGEAHLRTDAEGRFRVPHVAGDECVVEVWREGFARTVLDDVPVTDEESVIEIEPLMTIEGRVEFEDGRPASGIDVAVVGDCVEEGPAARARSGADGRFVLRRLTPGTWNLTVRGDGAGIVPRQLEGVEAGRTDVQIVVWLGRSIAGRVLDAEGRPPPGSARVAADSGDPLRARALTQTSADGSFALTGLDDGDYTLRIEAAGFLPAEVRGARGGGESLSLRLDAGFAVEGTLLRPDGSPAVGQEIGVVAVPGEIEWGNSTRTDEAGHFRISGLMASSHELRLLNDADIDFELPAELLAPPGATDLVVRSVPRKKPALEGVDGDER